MKTIKAVIGSYYDYASYTWTNNPRTKKQRHDNAMLEAILGPNITKMYLDSVTEVGKEVEKRKPE